RRHTRFSRDWSSDVCSSDLAVRRSYRDLFLLGRLFGSGIRERGGGALAIVGVTADEHRAALVVDDHLVEINALGTADLARIREEIGRASCRERESNAGAGGV